MVRVGNAGGIAPADYQANMHRIIQETINMGIIPVLSTLPDRVDGGGANTRVMQMLLEIGALENVENYVKKVIETGGKIMGLGHAVYKTDDPRAHILSPMSRAMGLRRGDTRWYDMSRLLEEKGKAAFREKKGSEIYVHVDSYSASLYYYMGIPVDLFTPVFAISRIAGWTAHFIEEQFGHAAPKTALYRPDSDYVGEYCGPEECVFVPIDER